LDIPAIADFVRSTLRVPLVQARLLFETPAIWVPAIAAGWLIVMAAYLDRRDRAGERSAIITEAFAAVFGVAIFIWFFHFGQFPWTEGDWREEWTFFFAWKQALRGGSVPYYIATAMQGTERYLANLQTPLMPYVFGLAIVSVNAFIVFHVALVYAIGCLGTIVLRRELSLGLLPWTLFVLIFTLNGHIVSHLSVGHLPWVAYFLIPWVLVSAIRTARGDRSMRHVITCAAAFAGMILIGGWHVFVWSLIFMIATYLTRPRDIVVLVKIGVLTALLAAVRLLPAVATFGAGANTFISGFPTIASVFASLVGTPIRFDLLDQWELDTYVGFAGFLLLCIGAIPFRDSAKRFLNAMLLPTALLIALSLFNVYEQTLFRLPGFVSERVTTRLMILPVLWLALSGAVRIDEWWRRSRSSYAMAIPLLIGACWLAFALLLRAQAWRPHLGPSIEMLPIDVLKRTPVESTYFWMFWLGLAVSIATVVAVCTYRTAPKPPDPRNV
jgi:hypothetical protein